MYADVRVTLPGTTLTSSGAPGGHRSEHNFQELMGNVGLGTNPLNALDTVFVFGV